MRQVRISLRPFSLIHPSRPWHKSQDCPAVPRPPPPQQRRRRRATRRQWPAASFPPYVELGDAARGGGGGGGPGDSRGRHDLLQPHLVLEAPLPHALLELRPQLAVDERPQLLRRHLRLRAGTGGGPVAVGRRRRRCRGGRA